MKNKFYFLWVSCYILLVFASPDIDIEEQVRSVDIPRSVKNQEEDVTENIKEIDFGLNGVMSLKTQFPDLDGSGISIVQKEHRPESTDLDISNNLYRSFLESTTTTFHATQVASIMVGRGVSSPQNTGVAPNAKLYSVSFNQNGPESIAFYLQKNISVVNNSFGTEIESFYGKNAIDYDATVQRIPTLLFVFSAGNIGYSNSLTGKYANIKGVANLTGNYKMAKNILTVGAIDQYYKITEVSSVGPAYDGRIKPEVVAFSNNGTSQAAALASGIVAISQQFYQKKYNQLPSSDLLKALLINSSDDVGAVGIDHQTGFGSLNALEVVKDINTRNFWENTLQSEEQKSITIDVPEHVEQLKVSLVWSDLPAKLNASKALVNDLDLTLTTDKPIFTIWQPWVLSHFPQRDSLLKKPVRNRDNLNNIEQITLDKPKAGKYKIQVYGNKLASQSQHFALAYRWQIAEQFSWIFPTKDSKIVANQLNMIRWKSTLNETKGKLEFSTDYGKTWKMISPEVNLKKGFYEWETPDVFSEIKLRISTNSQQFIGDNFIVSPIIRADAVFFCADSTKLSWNEPQIGLNGVKYHIYRLDKIANSWKKRTTVERLNATITGTAQDDSFSIEPVLASGKTGIRSDIINTNTSGVSCFYRDFTAVLEDRKGKLSLTLTSILGIKSIDFQKLTLTNQQNIAAILVNPNSQTYVAYDTQLSDGINRYQVAIHFTNGKTILSEISVFFYGESDIFWVFPNPLKIGETLNVQSNSTEVSTLIVSNILGLTVFENPIYYGANQLTLPFLSTGNYFFRIDTPDSPNIKKGKLTIIP